MPVESIESRSRTVGEVHKKLVTDEYNRPIAVQIDYADWLEIEKRLSLQDEKPAKAVDLSRHSGTLSLREEPLEYQARIRGEWQ
jgi:hypothetical protein